MPISYARYALGALSALLLSSNAGFTWELPVKVDAKFDVYVNIKWGYPKAPTAPWYTYFPYDPHLMGPKGNMYPNWPQPFPPSANTGARAGTTGLLTTAPAGQHGWMGAPPASPRPAGNPTLQQTSYQLPAYWQQR